jgi:hypothetical protein
MTLDYNRKSSAPHLRCMHASLGQNARFPDWELLGVDTTGQGIIYQT